MSPLSAIQPTMPAFGLTPSAEIADMMKLPAAGVQGINPAQPGDSSFSNILGRFVEEVNAKQHVASDAVASLQSGGNVSLHQAVIAMEEASVSFQLMVEVRNKLLESYQELMRMQV